MTAQSIHLELPQSERPSVWPWLIALLCGAGILLVLAEKIQTIPESLRLQAQQAVSSLGFNNVQVSASGRDLSLNGTVDINQSTVKLQDQLLAIPGVRVVNDELTAIDPVALAREQAQAFLQALSNIDTSKVAFQPGSVNFTADSDKALNQLAQLLSANPDLRIRIEGHTDDTGPEATNLRLSRQRANAVANHLTAHGVAADQLIAKGYGSSQPLHDNSTEAGRARNRRIEISYVD